MMRALSQTHSVAFGFNQCSIYSEFRLQATLLLYISISTEQQQQLLGREPIGSKYRESYPIIFDYYYYQIMAIMTIITIMTIMTIMIIMKIMMIIISPNNPLIAP